MSTTGSELTLHDVEEVRKRTGLDVYQFSLALGYSYATYWGVVQSGKLSRGMQDSIRLRFGKVLREIERDAAA